MKRTIEGDLAAVLHEKADYWIAAITYAEALIEIAAAFYPCDEVEDTGASCRFCYSFMSSGCEIAGQSPRDICPGLLARRALGIA